jgi:hypothetical protein
MNTIRHNSVLGLLAILAAAGPWLPAFAQPLDHGLRGLPGRLKFSGSQLGGVAFDPKQPRKR